MTRLINTREKVKAKIISQFANKNSSIRYLASAKYTPDSIRDFTVYTFSKLCMHMEIYHNEQDDSYSIAFIDHDEKTYSNPDGLIDLSLEQGDMPLYHDFEEVIISESGIKFRLTEYNLINPDYDFKWYGMTMNDWQAIEYDILNRTMNFTQFENYLMFQEACKKSRREGRYHTFKLEMKHLDKIKSMSWFKQLPYLHQAELIRIFTPVPDERDEYFRLIKQVENFKGFTPSGYKWNRVAMLNLKDIREYER